jgi:hypothetical protein
VAFDVPAKKWVLSAVKVIEVTAPITLASLFTSIVVVAIFAMVPSPAPTRRSPFVRSERTLIPYWNRRLAGPILLYSCLSRLISMMSPVRVPRKADVSVGSITMH